MSLGCVPSWCPHAPHAGHSGLLCARPIVQQAPVGMTNGWARPGIMPPGRPNGADEWVAGGGGARRA